MDNLLNYGEEELRAHLSSSYSHAVSISRPALTTHNGISSPAPTPVYHRIPCALSHSADQWNRSGKSKLTSAHQDLRASAVLFLDPQYTILPGDFAIVYVLSTIASYTVVGEPARYPSHQEVILARETVA